MSSPTLVLVLAGAILQVGLWLAFDRGALSAGFFAAALLLSAWGVVFGFGLLSARHARAIRQDLDERDSRHRATLSSSRTTRSE